MTPAPGPGIRAGRLRHRVTIQRPIEKRSSAGDVTRTWEDVCTVFAAVEPLSGREFIEAQQLKAEITHKVTMRGGVAVRQNHRIVHKQRNLNIVSIIDNDERDIALTLMCREAA